MKRILLFAALTLGASAAISATTLNIRLGGVTYAIPADDAGDMIYSNGKTLTVMGRQFNLSEITRMDVDESEIDPQTVTVTYSGNEASVIIPGSLARYVEADVTGAEVTLYQNEEVADDTCGEITYHLSGQSSNGQFLFTGTYKSTIELDGLSLTYPAGAPINIQNGKRIKLSVKSDTENFLTDGSASSDKGCLSCKGHLELKGHGSLTVTGKAAHAIYAKEYIEMKNCSIKILGAVKDGLNCNQYFAMESGSLNISGTADDGIQVSFKDDTNREAEDTGSITITGGTINVNTTANAAKALKADGDISITDGTITASVSGGGLWDSTAAKTKASSCLSSDGNTTVSGGTLNLTATGSGGKGISTDGTFELKGGEITVNTSGGMYAYVSGKEYTNYTGNADNLNSNYKSSPKGIKSDGNITVADGRLNITTKGNGGEGMESKAIMTINGGTIIVDAYDDGLNSSSHMYINGGDITSVATNNDALDSNGHMYINGGTIRAFGGSSPECGVDANEEGGYSVHFTGGTLLAVGGNNSTPSQSDSTQPYVSGSATVTAGTTVELKSGNTVLATFTVPDNYKSSSSSQGGGGWRPGGSSGGGSNVIVSCAGLTSGASYTLVSGTASSSVSARLTGSSSGGRPW